MADVFGVGDKFSVDFGYGKFTFGSATDICSFEFIGDTSDFAEGFNFEAKGAKIGTSFGKLIERDHKLP